MKEEVRSKTKKKIATETEETLIERERQEVRESFRLKRTIKGIRFPALLPTFKIALKNMIIIVLKKYD